jgi:DNA polymerase phi
LLIALLTKPQSFLREIANFTFKQLCTEIPTKSLAHMVEIVQTPNVEASKMLFDEEEIDQEENEDDFEDHSGDEDDSDDSDEDESD